MERDPCVKKFPIQPDTKSTNMLINNLFKLQQSEKENKKRELPQLSPIAKRLRKKSIKPQLNTLNTWISTRDVKGGGNSSGNNNDIKTLKRHKKSGLKHDKYEPLVVTKSSAASVNVSKKETKKGKTFCRTSSSESFISDLPSYDKSKKSSKYKKNKTLQRHNVMPSVDDILQEQKDLEMYKALVNSAEEAVVSLEQHCSLELRGCEDFKKTIIPETKVQDINADLHCKDMTLEELTRVFNANKNFLSDIFHGKTFCARHQRYYNYNHKRFDFTSMDLTYNTSTVVFTFDQIDHLLSLLQKQFDPEDKMTAYFFKVLLPELCLKIFMDTYDMTKEKAVEYLENRPLE